MYHPWTHSETGVAPMARWRDGIPSSLPRPTPAQLREAFLWSEHRTVSQTATVSLHANTYQVDELLVGRKVELVFDPFDLTEPAVRYAGREFGTAVAHHIGRHAHPKARPEQPDTAPEPTGIDYLPADRHHPHRTTRGPHQLHSALLERHEFEAPAEPAAVELDPELEAQETQND